jgi:hypothetical protein
LSFQIQIPTEIVRNKNINAMEFVLLAKLIQTYYISGKKEEFELHHKNLIFYMAIGDNNTFKKAYNSLVDKGYILDTIDTLPRKGGITVRLNMSVIPELNKGIAFTQLDSNILSKSVIEEIGHLGVRLIYYYQSYINKKDGKHYCFVSEEKIADHLGITKKTVITYNKKLKKSKLVKIVQHELKDNGEYIGERLEFKKYNNHYYVREDKLNEIN